MNIKYTKKLFLSFFVLLLYILPTNTLAASWQPYTIVEYLGDSDVLVSDGTYYYEIDSSAFTGCSFESADVGNRLYIDTILLSASPSFGNDIYYQNDWGYEYICTVENTPDKLAFKTYTILEDLDYEGILISDGNYEYIVDPSYECNFTQLDKGHSVYIDASVSPSYGDAIYFYDSLGYGYGQFCEVSNFPEKLALNPLEVIETDTLNSSITIASNGNNYYIETSFSCSYLYTSVGDYVYVDSTIGNISTYNTLYDFNKILGFDSCLIYVVTLLQNPEDTQSENSDDSALNQQTKVAAKKVKNINVKKRKAKKVKISWKKQSGAQYKIQVKRGNKVVKRLSSKKNTRWIKKLKSGKKYKIRVRAIVDGDKGKWSKWKKVKTK